VISTYLPIAAIRDWRHRDGQWQPVDGQALPDWPQPVPPAGTHGAAGWRTRFAVTLLLVIAAAILILTVIS